MGTWRKAVDALKAGLKRNEEGDRDRSERLDSLEKRVEVAERKLGKRVKTLEADE